MKRFPGIEGTTLAVLAFGLATAVSAQTVSPRPDGPAPTDVVKTVEAPPAAASPAAAPTGPEAATAAAPPPIPVSPGAHIVRPPAPGTKRFILVQIDPAAQAKALAALPPFKAAAKPPAPATAADGSGGMAALPTPGRARYDWYWSDISPVLGARSGRFARALAALTLGPDGASVAAPRLAAMQRIARSYGTEILSATVGTQVSPALVLAVMAVESGGNPNAVSSAGAKGLMQLMPATAARFGVTNVFDADENLKGGVAYLDWLMKKFGGDPLMVLAGYNAGENAVTASGGVPPVPETRDYVPKVLAAWTVAQGLCMTPPELVSDGCVFRVIAAAE